jgi:hypothetical protein
MLESYLIGAIEAVADGAIDADPGGRAATIATLQATGIPGIGSADVVYERSPKGR